MADLAELLVRIDATTEQLRRELRRGEASVSDSARRIDSQLKKIDDRFAQLGASARAFVAGFIGFHTIRAVGAEALDVATQFQTLQARLVTLTGSQEAAAEAQNYLRSTAQRLSVDIFALTDSYAKLLPLVQSNLLSTMEARAILEGFANVAKATGASTTQLAQSLFGLTQGLSSGILRAEELNQITEPLPGLLQKLDEAAGLSAGGFRRLVNDGKVTSDMLRTTLTRALEQYAGSAQEQAHTLESTFTRLSNAWKEMLRDITAPAVGPLAAFFEILTRGMERVHGTPEISRQIVEANAKLIELEDRLKKLRESPFFLPIKGRDLERQIEEQRKIVDDLIEQARKQAEEFAKSSVRKPGPPPGPTKEEIEKQKRLHKEMTELATRAALEQEKEREKAFERGREVIQQFDAIGASYQREIENNEKLIAALRVSNKEYEVQKALLEILDRYRKLGTPLVTDEDLERAEEMARKIGAQREEIQKLKEANDRWRDAAEDAAHAIGTAFEDAVLAGEKLSDVLKALEKDIARIILRMTVTKPLENAIGGLAGGFGNALGNFFGDIFGFDPSGTFGGVGNGPAARASGGPVTASTPFLVGERGPELFVPHTSGTIVSNDNLSRMGGGPVFNIDARGASVEAVVRLERMVRALNGSIESRAVAAVTDSRRRGQALA